MKRVIGRLSLPSIDFIILPFQGDYNGQDVHQPDDCSWHPCQTVVVPHEEHNDNRKKQVEVQISLSCLGHSRLFQIGGGPLAGATTIGAGYQTWNEVKEKKTEEEVGSCCTLILTSSY